MRNIFSIERLKFILSFLFVTTVFVTVIFFGFKLLIKMKNALFSLPPELYTPLIASVGTVLISVASVIISKFYERKNLIENEIRKQKIPIYEEFIKFSFKIFLDQKQDILKDEKEQKLIDEKRQKEMEKYFSDFTYKLIIWGSDEVIKEWADFKQSIIQEKYKDSMDLMYGFEKTLLAIRKDTGHKNKGFTEGSLLQLFINDLHKNSKK